MLAMHFAVCTHCPVHQVPGACISAGHVRNTCAQLQLQVCALNESPSSPVVRISKHTQK